MRILIVAATAAEADPVRTALEAEGFVVQVDEVAAGVPTDPAASLAVLRAVAAVVVVGVASGGRGLAALTAAALRDVPGLYLVPETDDPGISWRAQRRLGSPGGVAKMLREVWTARALEALRPFVGLLPPVRQAVGDLEQRRTNGQTAALRWAAVAHAIDGAYGMAAAGADVAAATHAAKEAAVAAAMEALLAAGSSETTLAGSGRAAGEAAAKANAARGEATTAATAARSAAQLRDRIGAVRHAIDPGSAAAPVGDDAAPRGE